MVVSVGCFPLGLSLEVVGSRLPQPVEVTDRSAGHVAILILRRAKPIFPTVSVGGRGAGLFSYENE